MVRPLHPVDRLDRGVADAARGGARQVGDDDGRTHRRRSAHLVERRARQVGDQVAAQVDDLVRVKNPAPWLHGPCTPPHLTARRTVHRHGTEGPCAVTAVEPVVALDEESGPAADHVSTGRDGDGVGHALDDLVVPDERRPDHAVQGVPVQRRAQGRGALAGRQRLADATAQEKGIVRLHPPQGGGPTASAPPTIPSPRWE
ncbi:MAG: hypothetical protein PGN07_04375 [Aeromicrobium erythreum]